MPAYNAEAFIRESIESILAQDWTPVEIVVVDDGSTDRTAEIVRGFESVRYLHQENAGPSAARNTAINESNGEFVAVLDSDDVMPSNRLTLQATYLLEHPEVGAVLGRQEWLNPPTWFARDSVYGDLDGIPLPSAMFRRSVLDQLGGYDTTFVYGEDTDLLIRMRELGIDYHVLPDVVLVRRFHEDSLTGGRPPHTPLLRSLRAKLDRDRAGGTSE
jgi:glycosyltransferase involved in cell wall biosynthesis